MEKKYRFVLYNIRYGTGSGWQLRAPFSYRGYIGKTNGNFNSIVDFIESLAPDIVGLIEVDGGSRRSRGVNQARQLANTLGHSYVFETKYTRPLLTKHLPIVRRQGNAFLSKNLIVNRKCRYFDQGIKRLFMEIELENCVVFLVHLSITYGNRQEQLRELGRLINQQEKPVIVAGDFNSFLGMRELKPFLESTCLQSANINNIRTFPSRAPKMELDFIFHSPEIIIHDLYVPTVILSDHRPLVCDFSLRDQD
ncbi:MAG: endonuclease/exonuclease/phosphatase family protein [Pseudomonadota bacterium]